MRTLAEYFRQRELRVEQRDASELVAQQKDERKRGLERLFDKWEPRVKALLGRAGDMLWSGGSKVEPRSKDSEWQVISDRRNLRWQLREKGHWVREEGCYEHTCARGYEVRLAEDGFDLSADGEAIRSPFDLAGLEDALVRLLEYKPEGCDLVVRTDRYHKWFAIMISTCDDSQAVQDTAFFPAEQYAPKCI